LIGGEVVVVTLPGCLSDARFLGTTSPVGNIVSGSQSFHLTNMVGVDFPCMTCHGLSHAEYISSSGTQIAVPQPVSGGQFGVGPGITSNVIAPFMSTGVVGMHYITVV